MPKFVATITFGNNGHILRAYTLYSREIAFIAMTVTPTFSFKNA